jgi:hypothetical protein
MAAHIHTYNTHTHTHTHTGFIREMAAYAKCMPQVLQVDANSEKSVMKRGCVQEM